MRTSLTGADKVERVSFAVMAAGLAGAAIFVVGAMTLGGNSSIDNDTAAVSASTPKVVVMPSGAVYARAVDGSSAKKTEVISSRTVVEGQPVAHLRQRVNRTMKGDRVFAMQESAKPQQIAKARSQLFQAWNLLAEEENTFGAQSSMPDRAFVVPVPQMAKAETTPEATINLAALRPVQEPSRMEQNAIVLTEKPVEAPKIDKEAMFKHARLAAKVLQEQQVALLKAKSPVQSNLTAYAPQEADTAQVFNAVLKNDSSRSPGRVRLGKGDHKWAAKRLPKHVYSKRERRCLSAGVYFEARGENRKGQQAVAQVILNRVKNPAYPKTVCGVVYQNKRMRNACQFSFACDGIRDRINSKKHWRIAKKVANDAIDGRVWLMAVGSSSHYHATYVRPRWRRSMKRMTKIGRHIFYRTFGGGWS